MPLDRNGRMAGWNPRALGHAMLSCSARPVRGTQAADIIRRNPGRFRVVGLAAGGGNPGLLAAQALEFGAEVVAVASGRRRGGAARRLRRRTALSRGARRGQAGPQASSGGHGRPAAGQRASGAGQGAAAEVLAGPDAVAEVAAWPCDVVLNAVTGSVGLAATLAALRGRPGARPGQQGIADHRRAAGGRAGRARPDRPGRLRALGDRAVPARRPGRARCARLVLTASGGPFLRPQPRGTGGRHARSRRSPTRPGTWARSSPSTPPRW